MMKIEDSKLKKKLENESGVVKLLKFVVFYYLW